MEKWGIGIYSRAEGSHAHTAALENEGSHAHYAPLDHEFLSHCDQVEGSERSTAAHHFESNVFFASHPRRWQQYGTQRLDLSGSPDSGFLIAPARVGRVENGTPFSELPKTSPNYQWLPGLPAGDPFPLKSIPSPLHDVPREQAEPGGFQGKCPPPRKSMNHISNQG